MRQWHEQKAQAGDAILLFRMGDFYEMFYADAELGARVLGIALTSRDASRTPLAGIPHHALESYLRKLVDAGYKVAISEQVEDPRQARGVVRREIVRVVTPGTLTDDALLERTQSNLLAAVLPVHDEAGLAALELSTGHFVVQTCPLGRVVDELARLNPAEILLPDESPAARQQLDVLLADRVAAARTYRNPTDFGVQRAEHVLREQFETLGLEGFGFDKVDAALRAAGALLVYVRETQRAAARHLRPPRRRSAGEHLVLDPVTLRSLEIDRTLRTGSREGTLAWALDRTSNPMGARLLRDWLRFPLADRGEIERRQRLVGALVESPAVRGAIQEALRGTADLQRLIGRLGVQRASPRDLRSLGDGLARLAPLRAELRRLHDPDAAALADALDGLDGLAARLCAALRPDAPLVLREGGIFADGYDPELDRLRSIGRDGQRWLAEFQAREMQRTGIPSLKVAYNSVFGYYIEITHAHQARGVPADYVRKQTVKNAERYINDELKRFEGEVLTAEARACELEHERFVALRDGLLAEIPALQRAAAALAELDVLAGWGQLAAERGYCRPKWVDEPVLRIEAGRHPVLEQTLGANFVPNDTDLAVGSGSLALITGPNMAGKSTYIRQVALLTLMAHAGCWVPAQSMTLGLVDRIFTRVGASDELARGQSTFMVEMVETANILHNASDRSLVILDEIGRGTSTFDGVALAWAITENLATRVGCRTLFATHYHELTELGELLEPVRNLNVAVREYEDQVVFLHRIVPGAADRSYGLHVAKLAGVGREVLERANAVLCELEKTFSRESHRPVLAAVQRRRQRQLRLFEEPEEQAVRLLRELKLEDLPPEAAARKLRELKALLGGGMQ
ncbi:MAG: DNA mismatch repair protein MutS [Phycisphaerales bacterium]|nr:DNA mismatch repair protein MutS [Phycisphaerales bacterium]